MMPITLPGPPVLSGEGEDDWDDDPLALLDLSEQAPCVPPATAGTRTRTPAGPAVRPLFYSTAGVAVRLAVSLHTVRKMLADGRLRGIKLGTASQSKWRIPADELDRLGGAPPPEDIP